MTILFQCDVQVVKYRSELVSWAANHLKVCFQSVVHLILKADSQFLSPLMFNPSIFSPTCPPSNFQTLHSCLSLPPYALSFNASKPPWTLGVRQGQEQTQSRAGAARGGSFSKVQTAGRQAKRRRSTECQEQCVSVQCSSCPCFLLSFVVPCCSSLVQRCLKNCKVGNKNEQTSNAAIIQSPQKAE